MRALWRWLGRLGSDPSNPEHVRLEKSLLVYLSTMVAVSAVLWGGLYVALGEPGAGAIPLTYAAISFATLVVFATTRRYRGYQISQLLLILLLPPALAIQLGGFQQSSGVAVWASLAPLGALMWGTRREALVWFGAFVVALLVVAGWPTRDNELSEAWITAFFVMNLSMVTLIAGIGLGYFVGERDRERAKSERLLLNVLPPEIAAELRERGVAQARHFDSVTVLFADIVGFTPLSVALPPDDLLALLDEVFTRFDELVAAAGLEKVRTIGDAYMVSSGAPRPRPDHAHAAVELGLAMLAAVREHNAGGGHPVEVRIGINSGPAVAGVIGRSKFQYDLWGDAVNLASRMESHGVPGRVQVAEGTQRLVADRYTFEGRGQIAVKGKGHLDTWLVCEAAR